MTDDELVKAREAADRLTRNRSFGKDRFAYEDVEGNEITEFRQWKDTETVVRVFLELAEAQEWQPIETAPKDGTEILLLAFRTHISGHWQRAANNWFSTGNVICVNPTHWMPLPQPPKESKP